MSQTKLTTFLVVLIACASIVHAQSSNLDNEDVFNLLRADIQTGHLDSFREAALLKFGFSKSQSLFERDFGLSRLYVSVSIPQLSRNAPATVEISWSPKSSIKVSEALINALTSRSESIQFYQPNAITLTVAAGDIQNAGYPEIAFGTYRHTIVLNLDGTIRSMNVNGLFNPIKNPTR